MTFETVNMLVNAAESVGLRKLRLLVRELRLFVRQLRLLVKIIRTFETVG